MSFSNTDRYRPRAAERWREGRTEPGTITVRTRFLYSDYDPNTIVPPGQTRHAFARGGDVVASDWPSRSEHMQSVADHVGRAVNSFGDDAELEITVRLVRRLDPEESDR